MAEKKKSVYSGIADDIIEKIRNNTYTLGSLLPPERELMSIYSVQRTTVRRGLEILSSKGYIKKVAGLGSVVNSKEATETAQKENAVSYIKTAEKKKSYSLLLSADTDLEKLPKLSLDLISSLGKAGTLFMTKDFSEIDKDSLTICLDCNPDTEKNVCLALCQSDDRRSVILDNDKGAYVALTHLESFGHTKIAFIGTDAGSSFENAAYDSFCAVNSFLDEELISLSGADEKAGFDGFSELFRRHGGKFSAVCVANDDVANGVIKAAKYYKVRIPEDMSVISLCGTQDSPVDSIYYNASELAKEVIMSCDACSRISTVLFGGTLISKGSCASAGDKASGKKMSDFLL